MSQIFKWKKKERTGSHTFRYAGKRYIVKAGMTIEVPKAALGIAADKYDCLGPVGEVFEGKNAVVAIDGDILPLGPEPPMKELVVVPHGKSKVRFDIINSDNPSKPLNAKPLRKEEAEKVLGKMLEDLKSEPTVKQELEAELQAANWDQLVEMMERISLPVLDEYETEDDLRQAIFKAMIEE